MTQDGTDALEQALALYATPGRAGLLRSRPLPNAVLILIRIAAGDDEAIASAARRSAETRQVVLEAAVLYIQQILFHESSDSYRLLGVSVDSPGESIKEHYRWLMRWLHPDRNPERWEVAYSERVNRAWHSLNTDQRRRDYDAGSQVATATAGEPAWLTVAPGVTHLRDVPPGRQPLLSPRTIQRLPLFVLAGIATLAIVWLLVFFSEQRDQRFAAMAASSTLASAGSTDEDSAQKDAIRERLAFEERVIEFSRPVLPASPDDRVEAEPPVVSEASSVAMEESGPDSTTTTATGSTGGRATVQTVSAEGSMPSATSAAAAAPASSLTPPAAPRWNAGDSRRMDVPSVEPRPASPPTRAAIAAAVVPSVPRQQKHPNPSMAPVTQSSASIASERPAGPAARTAASASRTVATPPAPALMSPQVAAVVVPREIEAAYASGDLQRMLGLFAPNAVENRGGIAAIGEDYDHLFRTSMERELRLDGVQWMVRPDRIVGSGAFEARIRRSAEASIESVHGWIEIDLIPLDGRWKIQRLLHRDRK